MMRSRRHVPWHAGAVGFCISAAVLAIALNLLGGDYFKRTFLEEANPLATAGGGGPAPATVTSPSGTPPPAGGLAPDSGNTSPAGGGVVLANGMFRDGAPGHHGKGTAKLGRDGDGRAFLVLESFSVTNGPDLHVILGETADGGGDGLDLGGLKETDGTFGYEIPGGVDLKAFKSVTIFCKSFPTVFAVATLEAM